MKALMAALLIAAIATPAIARDFTNWDPDSVESKWFQRQMQPESEREFSCCGEADAYWADVQETDGQGNIIAVITDDRDDNILLPDGRIITRPHIPVGTKIPIPLEKIKNIPSDKHPDVPHPEGHGIVFVGVVGTVFCYIMPLVQG